MVTGPDLGKRGEGWFVIQLIIFAGIIFVPAFLQIAFPSVLRWFGLALLLLGGIFSLGGVWDLGRHITPYPRPKPDSELVQDGFYRLVRHPIYTGLIFAALGWGLMRSNVITVGLALILFLFFDAKSRYEERWLVQKFQAYGDYQRRVAKLIPWVY